MYEIIKLVIPYAIQDTPFPLFQFALKLDRLAILLKYAHVKR